MGQNEQHDAVQYWLASHDLSGDVGPRLRLLVAGCSKIAARGSRICLGGNLGHDADRDALHPGHGNLTDWGITAPTWQRIISHQRIPDPGRRCGRRYGHALCRHRALDLTELWAVEIRSTQLYTFCGRR